MGADDRCKAVPVVDELAEVVNVRTRRVPDNQACSQMHDFRAVLLHLLRSILHVPPRAPIAGGVAHDCDLSTLVETESSFSSLRRSEAFPSSACVVTITDDDSNLHGSGHRFTPSGVARRFAANSATVYAGVSNTGLESLTIE
jgi:hypothetical protein